MFFDYYYLSLCGLCASMAKTTVLVGVNPCLTKPRLKKQSQYAGYQPEILNTKL